MNMNLRSILGSNKLTKPNFLDWLRNLRIILRSKKILLILDKAAPEVPPVDAPNEVYMTYNQYKDDEEMTTCLMLASMLPDLQNNMNILVLKGFWYTYKSCSMHNLVIKGFRPKENYFNVRWLKGH